MKEVIEKLTLKHRRPDVYKLLVDLGCRFKYIDEVPLDEIIIDQGIYPREKTDWDRVYMYAEEMKNGAIFPPILIAEREEDFKKLNLDGNHRYYGRKEAEFDTIYIEVWDIPKHLYPVVAQAVNTEEKEIDTPLTPTEKKKAILRDWEILTQYDKRTRKEIIAKVLKTSVAYVEKVLSEAGLIRSEKEELKQKARELKEKGYSVSKIAKKLGKPKQTISRWLSEDVSKFTEVKNETSSEEPDWSDWNEYQPEEAQDVDLDATERAEEEQEPQKTSTTKKQSTEKQDKKPLHPNHILERCKTEIWDAVIEIEFRLGEDKALEVLEEIYFAYKERRHKGLTIYKDIRARYDAYEK